MRPAGAPASSPPVLSTNLDAAAGKAYTVAGVGPNKSIKLRVLADDLSRPAAGMARMRVVQASSVAPEVAGHGAGDVPPRLRGVASSVQIGRAHV